MSRGLFLGKFMPIHNGHLHVINTAARLVDELVVLGCSESHEPISGLLRNSWLRASVPRGVEVVWWDGKSLPQKPEDDPHFWQTWIAELKKLGGFDMVFGGEDYVMSLAKNIGATPVPLGRDFVPVSATMIRNHPNLYWNHVPPSVRSHYQKRITLLGPESCGKSTLAKSLSFGLNVPEYGRTYDKAIRKGEGWTASDFSQIAATHKAIRESIAPTLPMVVIEDTDCIQTAAWEQLLIGSQDDYVSGPFADLYLLLTPEVEWVDDGTRYGNEDRQSMFDFLHNKLDELKVNYRVISGSQYAGREIQACKFISEHCAEFVADVRNFQQPVLRSTFEEMES